MQSSAKPTRQYLMDQLHALARALAAISIDGATHDKLTKISSQLAKMRDQVLSLDFDETLKTLRERTLQILQNKQDQVDSLMLIFKKDGTQTSDLERLLAEELRVTETNQVQTTSPAVHAANLSDVGTFISKCVKGEAHKLLTISMIKNSVVKQLQPQQFRNLATSSLFQERCLGKVSATEVSNSRAEGSSALLTVSGSSEAINSAAQQRVGYLSTASHVLETRNGANVESLTGNSIMNRCLSKELAAAAGVSAEVNNEGSSVKNSVEMPFANLVDLAKQQLLKNSQDDSTTTRTREDKMAELLASNLFANKEEQDTYEKNSKFDRKMHTLNKPHVPEMLEIMNSKFDLSSFKPVQLTGINCMMDGQDVIVVLSTGHGKSLIYQIVAAMQEGLTVVIEPATCIIEQQVKYLNSIGIPTAKFVGGNADERPAIWRDICNGIIKILFIAPEYLVEEKIEAKTFKDFYKRHQTKPFLARFVIDEAHVVPTWVDFREAFIELFCLCEKFPEVPIAAFTATITEEQIQDLIEKLDLEDPTLLIGSVDRTNVALEVIPKNDNWMGQCTDLLLGKLRNDRCLIVCQTRDDCEKLVKIARKFGITITYAHGSKDRDFKLEAFGNFESGTCQHLAGTQCVGLGIDCGFITTVVHAVINKSLSDYAQEIGRVGRTGIPARSILLYDSEDVCKLQQLVASDLSTCDNEKRLHLLAYMRWYVVNRADCRRAMIVNYHSKRTLSDLCSLDSSVACDNCKSKNSRTIIDVTKIALAITYLLVILKTEGRYWHYHKISNILRGVASARSLVNKLGPVKPLFGYCEKVKEYVFERTFAQLEVDKIIYVQVDKSRGNTSSDYKTRYQDLEARYTNGLKLAVLRRDWQGNTIPETSIEEYCSTYQYREAQRKRQMPQSGNASKRGRQS